MTLGPAEENKRMAQALANLGAAVARLRDAVPVSMLSGPLADTPTTPHVAALRQLFGTYIIEGHGHGFRVQPEKAVTAAVVARVVELMECAPEALVMQTEDDYSGCYRGEDPAEWLVFEVRA